MLSLRFGASKNANLLLQGREVPSGDCTGLVATVTQPASKGGASLHSMENTGNFLLLKNSPVGATLGHQEDQEDGRSTWESQAVAEQQTKAALSLLSRNTALNSLTGWQTPSSLDQLAPLGLSSSSKPSITRC